MTDPFVSRTPSLSDPTRDIISVTPSDSVDLPQVGVAFYAETAGTVSLITAAGKTRTIPVAEFMIVPVGVSRILSTGTTATGIHVFMVS